MGTFIQCNDIPVEFSGVQVRLWNPTRTHEIAVGELYYVDYSVSRLWRVDSDETGVWGVGYADWIEIL